MHNSKYQTVIQAIMACAAECNHCAAACLNEDHATMMKRCIMLDLDCAAICKETAAALARGSEMATTFLQTCATICDACADECGKHEHDHCKECAEACRRCAEACRSAV